jgi:hypothetical protein
LKYKIEYTLWHVQITTIVLLLVSIKQVLWTPYNKRI